jgi:hypothetical protein
MPEWALIPFFAVFYVIGFGVLYAGLREKYQRQRLIIGGGKITLSKQMFGKSKEKSLSSGTLTSVSKKEFYKQNYQPVYGIEIKGPNGKLRFGSIITTEERAWLLADMKKTLAVENKGQSATAVPLIAPMKVHRPKSIFSVAVAPPKMPALVASLCVSAFAIGFVCIGIFLIPGETLPSRSGAEGLSYYFDLVFSLFGNGFRAIWLLFCSFFALIGIGMTVSTVRAMNRDLRIEGNDAEISIRSYRRGLIVKNRSFPRRKVTDIRTSNSGHINGKVRKRIELIVGDKVEEIVNWIDGEQADAIAEEVRSALGVER